MTDHRAIRFHIILSFVTTDGQNGYQVTDVSHAETKESAIVEVMQRHMKETMPLAGIAVYELVFVC